MIQNVSESLKLFAPEALLVGFLVLIFLSDAFLPKKRSSALSFMLASLGLVIAIAATTRVMPLSSQLYFNGVVAQDGLANFFRILVFGAGILGLYAAYGSKEIEERHRTEYSILILCVVFGMSLMAISTNVIMLYIGIETVSIVSYTLAGLNRHSLRSNEASLKYLVYGALASGLMIYGFSLLYGITGSLQYDQIRTSLQAMNIVEPPVILQIAILLIFSGLAFKISAFPMHFWAPDVYEGSPTPVVTFFAIGPKAAGMAALIRIFLSVFAVKNGEQWTVLSGSSLTIALAVIAAITMFVGNFSAIAQVSVKRMLAYSSIAHVGYLLMGLVALNEKGLVAILFYLVAYYLMNVGAFIVTGIVVEARGSDDIESFRGLGWTNPFLGVCMAIFLFSLTGIPMFGGFIGKFLLFGSVVDAPGYLWLAIWGVLNSVVALFYYLRVVKAMWIDKPVSASSQPLAEVPLSSFHWVGLFLLALPTLLLGLFFSPVLRLAKASVAALLS